ncbi:MAG: hypothetical protein BWY31_03910 [Lentisphaerae bacterium ADurb.Bin242]|nr:MAG: hypothetical protein BWY31_03910 [Lentisphaerae bacterium ADurb.Bin242]
MWNRVFLLFGTLLLFCQASAVEPYEHPVTEGSAAEDRKLSEEDSILYEQWKDLNLPKIPRASDAVFIRRAFLTATGRLPKAGEVREFLKDEAPDKRAKLIDRLLDSPEHADMMTMRFADMLRIKSEFPINLWPNAVQAYCQKLRTDIYHDRPYSEIAREMLTASGSNFRVPYANFFRAAADRTPEGLAKVTALTFLGLRTEKLPEKERKEFAAFFSRIRYKQTTEWKEEIVYTDPAEAVVEAFLPGGGRYTIRSPENDPRRVFADALLAEDNPYFARAFVNRAWCWFFGRGLIDPADDITPEPGSWTQFKRWLGWSLPPENEVNPELLEHLTEEFRKSNYSMRRLFRVILNSAAFQASSLAAPEQRAAAEKYFAVYPVRRMESEVISDALGTLTGYFGSYSSVIPEPFTFLPPGTRAVQIEDGSMSSAMLDLFGRPPRDSGQFSERNSQINGSQRLFLLNSGALYERLNRTGGRIARENRWNLKPCADAVYLTVLSRYPTSEEVEALRKYQDSLPKKDRGRIWPDLLWVLVNSKEFLYYH